MRKNKVLNSDNRFIDLINFEGVSIHPGTQIFKGTSDAIKDLAKTRAKENQSYVFEIYGMDYSKGRKNAKQLYGFAVAT